MELNLAQHPLSAAFPSMSAEDFQALKDDIESNGQREPVMVFEGMVLDGWHRYQACNLLGIRPQQFTFSGNDPAAFVESANLHRRHLTASQRAVAVVAVRAWAPAGKKSEANVAAAATLGKTNAELAKEAKVSTRTIRDAKAAQKAGLTEAVKEGALTVEEAAKVARGKPEKAPKPAPWDAAAPKAEDLADAREAVTILAEENERLSDRLAVEAMDASEEEKSQAAETIAALREQVKTLTAELGAVKASRDAYMREVGELKRQCASQRRRLEKAGH